MKRSARSLIAVAVVLGLLLLVSSVCAAQRLQRAPVNPEFIAYRDAVFAGTWRTVTSDGHRLGAIPAPQYRPPSLRGPVERPRNGYPSSYDLRGVSGKLPAVRDQNPWGSCWAHATYASMESCLRPGDTFDGSENNMMNLHGFDYNCNQGGHPWMSMAYLARWSGAVAEASDPYNNVTCSSPGSYTPAKHVQEVWVLPSRTSATDNDTIKGMVTNYGAVYVVYYHDNTYYNATNYAYYYNGSAGINHAVAVVGWDDNYSATNFNSLPAGNGAFIVRNSWGSGWGESGYFYVSYYDTKMGYSQVSMFPNAEATTNYTGIYSYDPLGDVSEVNTPWAANIFATGGAAQTIQAVGFYTPVAGANYTAYVYTNPTGGNPRSGTLAATETGTRTHEGYATVPLSTPVSLSTSDSTFSVVTYLTSAGSYPSAYEGVVGGYTSGATASAGQSYYSFDGSSWTDLTTFDNTANFCLKAYAGAPASPSLDWAGTTGYTSDGVDPDTGDPTITAPTTFTFKVKYTDPTGNAPTVARCVVQTKQDVSGWSDYARTDMTLESGAVATGAIYSCATGLPNQLVKYRFLFLDSTGTAVAGTPATFQEGQPSVSGVPHLCWSGKSGFETDGVSPDSGGVGTSFKFQVKYMDAAGDAATQAQVEVRRNGSLWRTLDMSAWASGSDCTGRIYQCRTTINQAATYEYRFAFADATGAAVGDPTAWQSAPTITGVTTLTSLAALPTKAGAQVTFSLSGAARVTATVVNIAGRPIRTIVAEKPVGAGLQTLVWDRKAESGLTVPGGLYLIRVSARSPEGGQSTALATIVLK